MQRKPTPLILVTAMHPAREHDVTSLRTIPPTPDGSRAGFGCLTGDPVPESGPSADPACTGCTGLAGRLARPALVRAVVHGISSPTQGKPGTFRKSLPPGTAGGLRVLPFISAS